MSDNELNTKDKLPDGKVESDEGEIKFSIAHTDSDVILDFGRSVSWLEMDPDTARQLGKILIDRANMVENIRPGKNNLNEGNTNE